MRLTQAQALGQVLLLVCCRFDLKNVLAGPIAPAVGSDLITKALPPGIVLTSSSLDLTYKTFLPLDVSVPATSGAMGFHLELVMSGKGPNDTAMEVKVSVAQQVEATRKPLHDK